MTHRLCIQTQYLKDFAILRDEKNKVRFKRNIQIGYVSFVPIHRKGSYIFKPRARYSKYFNVGAVW